MLLVRAGLGRAVTGIGLVAGARDSVAARRALGQDVVLRASVAALTELGDVARAVLGIANEIAVLLHVRARLGRAVASISLVADARGRIAARRAWGLNVVLGTRRTAQTDLGDIALTVLGIAFVSIARRVSLTHRAVAMHAVALSRARDRIAGCRGSTCARSAS